MCAFIQLNEEFWNRNIMSGARALTVVSISPADMPRLPSPVKNSTFLSGLAILAPMDIPRPLPSAPCDLNIMYLLPAGSIGKRDALTEDNMEKELSRTVEGDGTLFYAMNTVPLEEKPPLYWPWLKD